MIMHRAEFQEQPKALDGAEAAREPLGRSLAGSGDSLEIETVYLGYRSPVTEYAESESQGGVFDSNIRYKIVQNIII